MKHHILQSDKKNICLLLAELPPHKRIIKFNGQKHFCTFNFHLMILTPVLYDGNNCLKLGDSKVFGSKNSYKESDVVHPIKYPHVAPKEMHFCYHECLLFDSPEACLKREVETLLCSNNRFYMNDLYTPIGFKFSNPTLYKSISVPIKNVITSYNVRTSLNNITSLYDIKTSEKTVDLILSSDLPVVFPIWNSIFSSFLKYYGDSTKEFEAILDKFISLYGKDSHNVQGTIHNSINQALALLSNCHRSSTRIGSLNPVYLNRMIELLFRFVEDLDNRRFLDYIVRANSKNVPTSLFDLFIDKYKPHGILELPHAINVYSSKFGKNSYVVEKLNQKLKTYKPVC